MEFTKEQMKRPSEYMIMTDGVTRHDYERELNKYIDYLEAQNKQLNLPAVTNCTEIEAPYFDKKGKEIKEFALLKIYHFFGVNDQGRGRKHHYMYKWVCLEEYKGKKYWSALHLTNGDGGKFRLRAVADKQTRIIAHDRTSIVCNRNKCNTRKI
jgi:hypothetical protein